MLFHQIRGHPQACSDSQLQCLPLSSILPTASDDAGDVASDVAGDSSLMMMLRTVLHEVRIPMRQPLLLLMVLEQRCSRCCSDLLMIKL
jgi:hypothetical protein